MATTEDLPKAWRPPMGWNSWDSYGTTVTESEVLANARFMAEHLKDLGLDRTRIRLYVIQRDRQIIAEHREISVGDTSFRR